MEAETARASDFPEGLGDTQICVLSPDLLLVGFVTLAKE